VRQRARPAQRHDAAGAPGQGRHHHDGVHPRDTYVTVPAYDADGVHHRIGKDKFTNVITAGGPSLLVATVEQLTGLQVDHYVSVDLAGFKRITDAVGGVDVCVKRSSFSSDDSNDAGTAKVHSITTGDPFSGWHGGPGTLHVNGEQALAFVRQRHGLPDGDLNRIERQQQFLGSVRVARPASSAP